MDTLEIVLVALAIHVLEDCRLFLGNGLFCEVAEELVPEYRERSTCPFCGLRCMERTGRS